MPPIPQAMIAAGPGDAEGLLRPEQPPRADDRALGGPDQSDEADLTSQPGATGRRAGDRSG